jgi:hypothetical protein
MTHLTVNNFLTGKNNAFKDLWRKLSLYKVWNERLQACLGEDDADLAAHCKIVRIDKAALIVLVDNPHWITRFRFHIPQLLLKLRKFPEFAHVQAICCKAHPNFHNLHANKPTQVKSTPPLSLSIKSSELITQAAERITDTNLRSSLIKLAQNNK